MVRMTMSRLQYILSEILPRCQHRISTVVFDATVIRDLFFSL